ncbi:MAG: aldehyde ferredoxin oxidoreductase [Desulfobacteraceae bacterium]|nr:MAG: aldehyde ferredoxin oxidoreductase [Desulfobacteraceae bacterium]
MAFLGHILDVELSTGKWSFSPYPTELIWKILGGRGFNAWFLYQNIPAGTDPMGPNNILTFSCGVLTGTAAPASSRLHIGALSPLTGLLGSSNVGGDFGAKLRSAGIQSLIIRGRASKPVYLLLDGDTVKILDAKALWGMDTWKTHESIKNELGDQKQAIVTIGPGGENIAHFACIMSGRDHAAGRTGMGAVMGSKNLKAIVIKGDKKTARSASMRNGHDSIKRYLKQIKSSPEFATVTKYGGAGYIKWADDMGILATRNYRENHFEGVDRLDGRRLEKYVTRSRGCRGCPVHCKAELEFTNGRFKGTNGIRPEFEPMICLGSKCGLSDLEEVVFLDNLCSRLGLDNISAGSAIAFAMDLWDRGILTSEDTGGMDLTWGNSEAMETLIRQMAYREGLGAILCQGIRRAAQIFGRGSERFAPHVKGLELPGYHPYEIMGTALGYAISNRGGDFNDIYATLEYRWSSEKATKEFETPMAADIRAIHGKAPLVKRAMIVTIVLDCLGLCKVPALCLIGAFDLEGEAALTTDLTGWSVDAKMLFAIGERIATLERLFNYKHGKGRSEDRLPDMFFEKEYTPGEEPSQPAMWIEPMKQAFYKIMGWDEQGWPKEEKLKELGLWEDIEGSRKRKRTSKE